MRFIHIFTLLFAMTAIAEEAPAPSAEAASVAAPSVVADSPTPAPSPTPSTAPSASVAGDDVTMAPPMQANIDVRQIPPLDERNSANLEDFNEAMEHWERPRFHGMRDSDDDGTADFSSVTTTSITSRTQGGFQGGGTTTMFTQRVDTVRYHVNTVFGPSSDGQRARPQQMIPMRENVGDETGTIQ